MPQDFFGQDIEIGDFVLGAQGHELQIYKVIKITPKMIRIVNINAQTHKAKKGKLRYAKELAKVDGKLATFHVMKSI